VTIEVLEPGALTSVQDPVGRRAWRHLGVPAGGAADPWGARLANRLAGNADDAALLEVTLVGPTLRVDAPMMVARTGSLEATIDGLPWPSATSRPIRAGSVLRVADGLDARGYLAFGGGLLVEPVLGSPATDLRTGFGGIEGRALRAGDRLQTGSARPTVALLWTGAGRSGPIGIVPGPHADQVSPEAITDHSWRISQQSDRTGARLDGPAPPAMGIEIASIGLPAGAIQLPPSGQPIIALADRPVTGGYPVPAVVIGADLGRVARLRPGDELRLVLVTLEEARRALREAEEELAAVEPFDTADDDELRWVGSHN
jgi:biotin-dependent carboxylase-like uncharacterized protein